MLSSRTVALLFAACYLIDFCDSSNVLKTPKRYKINLDIEPEKRWSEVIADHADAIPAVIDMAKSYVPLVLQKPLFWLAKQVSHMFPDEYVREMQGIASQIGLPLGEVIGINILYDITNYDGHLWNPLACTSIVLEDSRGRILHGRNLDYKIGPLMRNLSIIADFTKHGKTIYTAVTFAMYVGVLTGQRPNAYTLSLNARYSGSYLDNLLMEIYTRFKNPISFDLRQVLQSKKTYQDAMSHLTQVHFVVSSYIILSGNSSGQGAVITRSRWSAVDMFELNTAKGRWFLIETNYDHWKRAGDNRRKMGVKFLTDIGRDNIDKNALFSALNKNPLNNEDTIFTTVMSAAEPDLVYHFTKIQVKS